MIKKKKKIKMIKKKRKSDIYKIGNDVNVKINKKFLNFQKIMPIIN